MAQCNCGGCKECLSEQSAFGFLPIRKNREAEVRRDPMREQEELHRIKDGVARISKGIYPAFMVFI